MAGVQIDGVNNKIDFDDDLDTSISANTDDTLVIEAGGNTMATITATTFTINDGTTITTADNTDTLTLVSTDADALVGPNLNFYRNSSSPADGDLMGQIKFTGESAGSGIHTYGSIVCENNGITDGQEQGKIKFNISMPDGALANVFNIDRTEVIINEDSEDLDFRVESNGNTHQLFVDAGTDNTMIGTSTNIDRWFNSAPGHSTIFQTSGFNDANRVNAFTHHSNDSGSAMFMLGKSRGGAVGYTAVAESDEIGQISFQGADGTDMVEAAKILVVVDAAPGANDMPGRMSFHTTADGASSSTERVRIHNNGVASFNNGIALGVGTANTASNVLDDYEEGTWTPASNNQGMATIHTAFYTKIGEFVSVYCDITRDSTPSDTSQGTAISGLPFNSGDDYPTGGSIIPGVGESVITVAGGDNMNFRGTDLVPITRSQTAGERCQHYVTYLTL